MDDNRNKPAGGTPDSLNRRKLLIGGGAMATGAAAGLENGWAQSETKNAFVDTTKEPGTSALELGQRSSFENVKRQVSGQNPAGLAITPLENLNGIITPSDLHFERHHAGIPVIDPAQYELLIHGMVERPLKFTLADLKRFPAESRICFIECSGNGFVTMFEPQRIPTKITPGRLDGLFSVSEWTGVRLSTLLKEAGARSEAKWFLAEGQDAAVMTRSIPMYKAWDDALVVYGQNGEALRPGQGYPVRLMLPGWEGNTSVKWLRRIELSDAPFMTREETSKYSDALKNGRIEMFSFTMAPKSLITSPAYPEILEGKGYREIRGLAWSGNGKIAGVEVSVDGGKNWRPAKLQTPVLSKCATRFRFMWEWDGKPTMLLSRATDDTGMEQPSMAEIRKTRGAGTFYHNNSIRPWAVDSDGQVTFGLRDLT